MSKLPATTVLLEVVTVDGTAAWRDPWAGRGYRSFQATPPSSFGDWQPAPIDISITHDGPVVGRVHYLESGLGYGNGGMFGVGVVEGVDADLIDGQLMCSPEIRANAKARLVPSTEFRNGRMRRSDAMIGDMHATHAELHSVALVDRTAGITSTRVRAWPGSYLDPVDRGRWSGTKPSIIDRAIQAAAISLRSNRPEMVRIHRRYDPGLDHDGEDRNERTGEPARYRMIDGVLTEIHYHGGGYVLGVH